MPEIVGNLRPPRIAAAPSSPALGEMYFDTVTNKLFWWNGTLWVAASGSAEVYEQPAAPASPGVGAIWIDTDDVAPTWTSGVPFVTTLPTNPVDGQEVYYQVDATAGIIWHLRYRAASASAYKWEFIGGPPLTVKSTGAQASTGGGWFSAPVVTIPRAGDYRLGVICDAYGSPNTVNLQVWWGIQLGDGTTAFGVDYGGEVRFIAASVTGAPSIRYTLTSQDSLRAGLAAGTTIKMKPNATNWDYTSAFQIISALPVRVS